MSEEPNDSIIRFSVKELLARVDLKIDQLDKKVDHRFDDHESRLRALESSFVTDDALEIYRKDFRNSVYKALGLSVAVLSFAVAAANYYL